MANSKGDIQINIIAKSDKFKSEADIVAEKLDKIKRAAYSANLSMLFAGAALQRISQSIMTFGTRAYDDISHSIVGTVTANDRLAGSMTMLGFSVGEALQPLLEFLIPIVEYFAEWVEENQTLVMWVVGLAAAIGTLVTVMASVNLIIATFGTFVGNMGLAIGGAGVAADTAAKGGFSTLLGKLGSIKTLLGAGILLYVGYEVFGKDKNTAWTTEDFIKNLGLATIGGFMAGGPWGALAAFTITLAVMLSQDSVTKALKDAEKTYQLAQKIMKGTLTADDAVKNFGRLGMTDITALPSGVGSPDNINPGNKYYTPTSTGGIGGNMQHITINGNIYGDNGLNNTLKAKGLYGN